MEIDLGKGHVAVIDDEDADLVTGFKWYPMKAEGKIYAAGWKHMPPGRFFVHLHRLIANAQPGEIIDHADRDTLNCRRSNLRRVTRQQNCRNRGPARRQCTSKYKGVFLCRQTGRFRARIGHDRKQIYLGYFNTEEEAARAYNAKAAELFGEFAYLNPVPDVEEEDNPPGVFI
jgi:HNH endonuclease